MVPWFAYKSIFNGATAEFVKMADGDLCKTDGTTMEAFPKILTTGELVIKYKGDAVFKLEYEQTRKGVAVAEDRARVELVHTQHEVGYEIYKKMAFVHKDEFERCGGGKLGSTDCSAVATCIIYIYIYIYIYTYVCIYVYIYIH